MINHLIFLIIVSILVVFFPAHADAVMAYILLCHANIMDFLSTIFSDGQTGHFIRDFLGLIILPFAAGLVVSLIYWLIRRRLFSSFIFTVWTVWLLQLGALIVLNKV